MHGSVTRVIVLDRLQVETPISPSAALLRRSIVFRFQHDVNRLPELRGQEGVIVGVRRLLHQYAVIAQRHPQFAGIAEQLDAPALNRKIVVYHHQRVWEILVLQVDLPDGCGCRVGSAGARNSVPLAHCPPRASVATNSFRISVIACAGGCEEMLQSPEEDRIVIIGLPICPWRVDTLPIAVEVTLGACLPYPLWRGIGLVAVGLRGSEPQRDFLALGDPALREYPPRPN